MAATHPTAPPAPRPGPLHRAVFAQARMELTLMVRSAESLVVTLGIPLGILVFFSQVEVLPTGADDPVEFLVPGVLAISVIATAMVALSIQTAFERKYAVLKRLGTSPMPRSAFMVAKALAVGAAIVVQTLLVLVIAVFALGWSPDGGALMVFAGMVVGTLTFSSLGLLMAGALKAEVTLALTNAVFLGLLLVSGLMFDADSLPGPVAAVGRALPSGALGEVLRGALTGQAVLGSFVVLSLWAIALTALAARLFRWEP